MSLSMSKVLLNNLNIISTRPVLQSKLHNAVFKPPLSNYNCRFWVFNTTRILDTTNFANQDYVLVNYTPIVVSMLLVTGSQSKNVPCFCLDSDRWLGQSLCNAIYWTIMGFSVYWCSRWNGHIEYIETTAYGVLRKTRRLGLVLCYEQKQIYILLFPRRRSLVNQWPPARSQQP
jgi:hypothetical protein